MKISIRSIQWTGQYYVAGELSRRGCIVTFPRGNAKQTDILCKTPSGHAVRIEVKTTRKKYPWWHIKDEPEVDQRFFWVFVSLAESIKDTQFWVVPSDVVRAKWEKRRQLKPVRRGVKATDIADFKNRWEVIE